MSSCGDDFIKTQCNYKNDYECQRKCNISKLKELYDKQLNQYSIISSLHLMLKRLCQFLEVHEKATR